MKTLNNNKDMLDPIIFKCRVTLLAVLLLAPAGIPQAMAGEELLPGLKYYPDNGAIACLNGALRDNRPLYCNQRLAFVLAGEMPSASGPFGILTAGIIRGDTQLELGQFGKRIARYRAGVMEWEVSDDRLPGLTVILSLTTLADANGMTARVTATGTQDGDRLVWCILPPGSKAYMPQLLDGAPDRLVMQDSGSFTSGEKTAKANPQTGSAWDNWAGLHGRISSPHEDAAWKALSRKEAELFESHKDFAKLLATEPAASDPAGLSAVVPLSATNARFLAISADGDPGDAAAAFSAGLARVESMAGRVTVDTPDPYLNAGVAASTAAVYGNFVPPHFMHGGNLWRAFYLGWRTRGGATAYGWRDLVRMSVKDALDHQRKESPYTGYDSVPQGTMAYGGSRFFGVGYIDAGQHFYNMQTQMFDEAVRDWRYSGNDDPDYIAQLLTGLELHVDWQKDCFDPDGDGLYESYINTWPSDSVWYGGGGSVEESVYAYSARRAAADMRRQKGDLERAAEHDAVADRIREALQRVLWLPRKGHYAAYIEQGGHKRVHEDAWVLSEYLPVEAGICKPMEAWQALYYTDYAMEKHRLPRGEMRQTSNWVPGHWSVREWFGGDNFSIALGYFLSGQGDDGWSVLQGTMLESMYGDLKDPRTKKPFAVNLKSPGGLSKSKAAIDFNDVITMFARSVVEGLFGFNPDYPNGIVRITPSFPADWDRASIQTPDFSLKHERVGDADRYDVELTRPAKLSLRLPVRAESVTEVTVNGQPVPVLIEPWAGCAMLRVETPELAKAEVLISLGRRRSQLPPVSLAANLGATINLASPHGAIESLADPQTCLAESKVKDGKVTGRIAGAPGNRMFFAKVGGDVPFYHLFKLEVTDQEGEAERKSRIVHVAPADAKWTSVPMTGQFNGAIQGIFQQEYRSPRPKTISTRIAYDGYRAWTFPFWKSPVPTPGLDKLPDLRNAQGMLETPQRAVFAMPEETRNIAFTSLWDNWPASVTVPVNQSGQAVWLLVCGSSNPMQGRIANAVLKFRYADGKEERLELEHPSNFWSLTQFGKTDYDYELDGFSLPVEPPTQVRLGADCRAMVYGWKLRPGAILKEVTLETLSQEVVIGLMAVSVMAAD
jgi:hypothetical protein